MSRSESSHEEPGDDSVGATARVSADHHAGLWSTLVQRVDAVIAAVAVDHEDLGTRHALIEFLRGDVMAHLQTEERFMYAAAAEIGSDTLVATLELDHRFLMDLVHQIAQADTLLQTALLARALLTLVGLRIEKEENVLIPALREAGVDVPGLLDGMVVAMTTDYDSSFSYL